MQAINFAFTLPVKDPGPRLALIVIAHHVNYRTGNMFVGQDELAEEIGCSERTLRRYLKALEEAGFLTREERRSDDGKRTTDCITLVGYLDWQHVVEHGGTLPDPKTRGRPVVAADEQPDNLAAGCDSNRTKQADQPDKKPPTSGQGVSGIKTNHFNQVNHSAREGARREDFKSGFGSEVPPPQRARPCFTLTPTDAPQWRAWIASLPAEQAEAAESAGKISVTSRWPDKPGAELLAVEPHGLSKASRRMAGDVE